MTEKSFYPAVQDYLKKNLSGNIVLELKLTKTNTFNLSKMEPHQLPWLYAAKHQRVTYKIADVGFDRKPCDIIMFNGAQAYVGIIFYIPHKKKALYLIDIDAFLLHQKSGRVSMNESEALIHCTHHHHL